MALQNYNPLPIIAIMLLAASSLLAMENQKETSKTSQTNALFAAVEANKFGQLTKLLKHSSIDLNKQINTKQETLLICAIRNKCRLIAEKLIAKGIDLDAQDLHGRTAVHWAVQMPDSYILELLIKAQATLTKKDDLGLTAEQYAWPSCKTLLHNMHDYKCLFLSSNPIVSFYPENGDFQADKIIDFLQPYCCDQKITVDHLAWIFRSPHLKALQTVIQEQIKRSSPEKKMLYELNLLSTLLNELKAFEQVKKLLQKTIS